MMPDNQVDPENIGIVHVRKPSFIENIENGMIEALKAGVSGSVKVEPFPADPDTYDFVNLDAAALVHYSGSNYKPMQGQAQTRQERRFKFAVVLLVRNLRGAGGSYDGLEDIRLAIQGNVFAGAGPAEIISDALEQEEAGVWRWRIVFGLDAPAIARPKARSNQIPSALMRPAQTD